jgi:hypothetical protein
MQPLIYFQQALGRFFAVPTEAVKIVNMPVTILDGQKVGICEQGKTSYIFSPTPEGYLDCESIRYNCPAGYRPTTNEVAAAQPLSYRSITHVFYSPTASWGLIDGAFQVFGYWYSYHEAKSYEEMRAECGEDLLVLTYEEAEIREISRCKLAPARITAEQYDDALNCLPPANWHRSRGVQSFNSPEMYSGTVASIYVQIGGNFFKFRDVVSLTHDERVQLCVKWLAANPAPVS